MAAKEHVAALLIATLAWLPARAAEQELRNSRYTLSLQADGAVRVTVAGLPQQMIEPAFTVMSSAKDPGYFRSATHPNYHVAPRTAVRWQNCQDDLAALNQRLGSMDTTVTRGVRMRVAEDAKGSRVWSFTDAKGQTKTLSGRYAAGTVNPFAAGQRTDLRASHAVAENNAIRWTFDSQSDFVLCAEVTLPPGEGDPLVTSRLTVKQPAFYSVAFTGMQEWPDISLVTVPQECIERTGRCDYLMAECDLKLPRAQLWTGEWSQALVVDPGTDLAPQPDAANSRFGLMLQRQNGQQKAVAFAPIMGGAGSHLPAGGAASLAVRCVFQPGDWKETYRHIARAIYRFRDLRDNSGPGSLNGTLERIVDFLSDRNGKNFAMWSAEQKYYDYWSDRSGIYKPFSPMFGLGVAIVTDDEPFYRNRALPAVEFALSRKYNVFAPYETIENGQAHSAERALGGSYLGYAQLAELSGLFQNRTFAVRACADERGMEAKDNRDQLAAYRLTGDGNHLTNALKQADAVFKKSSATQGLPPALGGGPDAFMDYLDLYEATGEKRYLQAAVEGAYGQTLTLDLSPAVPDRLVTVDQGGQAPIHLHSFGRHKRWGFPPPRPLPVPEQTVPAWRTSLIGIPSIAYRGEYWMNEHAQMLRVAALAGDDFLRDIARWGMVGRFGNYPGDNCSQSSLVAERPDAADRPIWECTHATINPGHAWEFAGAVLDFLVTDAFQRSAGAIDFPSRSMPGSAFRTKAYGDRPGRFYDEPAVRLWLPRGLLQCSNPQFDYLAAYSGDRFCLALWNQSFQRQQASVALNPKLVDSSKAGAVRVWRDNKPAEPVRLESGQLTLDVPAKGMIAFVLSGAPARPNLQAKMFDLSAVTLGPSSRAKVAAPFGTVYAMLITLGRGLTTAFVYTDALPEKVIEAKLRFRQGAGEWQERTDGIFPYEFSAAVDEAKGDFQCEFEVKNAERVMQKTQTIVLRLP